jgi:hypothetical protein
MNSIIGALCVASLGATALGQPANDNCGSATVLSSGSQTVPIDNSAATTDGPDACGLFGSDIWFRWTPTSGGPVRLSLCDSFFDTTVAVYTGTCGSLTEVDCNDDSCGLQSELTFNAQPGQEYFIRVGGFDGEQGTGSMVISSGIITGPVVFPGNGNSFYLVASGGWDDAQALAQSLGGYLASIRSQAENDFVQTQVLGFDGADRRGWIGFTDETVEGQFAWTSGESVDYLNWNPGEPNNANGIEDYTEMLGSNGQWNDVGAFHGPTQFALIEVNAGGPCDVADFNNDGTIDFFDYLDFVAAFDAESPSADVNNDGTIDFFDYLDYVAAFDACD